MYIGLESYGLILIHIYPYLEKYHKLPSSLQRNVAITVNDGTFLITCYKCMD